jgi:hypothetical protein
MIPYGFFTVDPFSDSAFENAKHVNFVTFHLVKVANFAMKVDKTVGLFLVTGNSKICDKEF